MTSVVRKRAILAVNSTTITIEPERLLVWEEPICTYRRSVDGTLQSTLVKVVTKVEIEDTMDYSDFQNLLSFIGTTATVDFVKQVLPTSTDVWVSSATVSCLVMHPIEFEETDTLYQFRVRLEEI